LLFGYGFQSQLHVSEKWENLHFAFLQQAGEFQTQGHFPDMSQLTLHLQQILAVPCLQGVLIRFGWLHSMWTVV
jgi:hypothetical protein